MKLKKAGLLFLVMLFAAFTLAGCIAEKPVTQAPATEQPAAETPAVDFPAKNVEITVSYAAGGSIDLCARIVAKYMESALGQAVTVVNREGGGGATGTTHVATAAADGYTMLCNVPTHIYQKQTAEGIAYDRSSFRTVAQVADDPICMSVLAGGEFDVTLPELIQLAKDAPDTITIGITSNWGAYDIGRLMIESAAGVQFRRVSFDGGANGVKALLSGDLDVLLSFPGEVIPYMESEDIKVLGVATAERTDALAEVPTFTEQGYDVVFGNLRFFSVPAGTPDEVVEILQNAIKQAFDNEDFQREMLDSGFPVLVYSDGPAFDEFLINLEAQLQPLVEDMLVQKAAASQ